MSSSIYETIYKFRKLYDITLNYKEEFPYFTPNYIKSSRALIHLSAIFYGQILRLDWFKNNINNEEYVKLKIYNENTYLNIEDLNYYTNEILKFYTDTVDEYLTIEYTQEIHELILNL
jgi:hypothetical protein